MAVTNNEANARLIAAAPETAAERDQLKALNAELLAALEKCVSLNDYSPRSKDDTRVFVDVRSWEAFLSHASAAIAKAEGR